MRSQTTQSPTKLLAVRLSLSFLTAVSERRRVTCNICSKNGHTGEDCFRNPKNQQNREIMRCYNCFQKGHMAIRCTRPPGGRSGPKTRKPSKNGRKEPKSEKDVEKEKAAAAINMKVRLPSIVC